MKMKNYLSVIFLIANYLIYLIFMPFVDEAYPLAFDNIVLFFAIFATLANLNYGLSPLIIRNYSNGIDTKVGKKELSLFSFISVAIVFLLVSNQFELFYFACMILAPVILFLNIIRSYLEGSSKFLLSFAIKFFITCIVPLSFSAYFLFGLNYWFISLMMMASSLVLFNFYPKKLNNKSININFSDLTPFLIQFFGAFLFMFLDRWIIFIFFGKEAFATFSFYFEIIIKLSLPIGFILTIAFPTITKLNKSFSERMYIYLIPLVYLSLLYPGLYILNEIYLILDFSNMSYFINANFTLIFIACALICLNLYIQKILIGVEELQNLSSILILATLISSIFGVLTAVVTRDPIYVLIIKGAIEFFIYSIWIIITGKSTRNFFFQTSNS